MTNKSNLVQQLLDRIDRERKLILVIGDAVVDVWVHGRVEECQDNCLKFVQLTSCETLGGAANAARSLINWQVPVQLFSWAENDRPVKTRFVDSSGRIVFRYDNEVETIERNRGMYEWARTDTVDAIRNADAVLLSDYDKGFMTPEFIREVSTRCRDYGIPCVADCKRAPYVYNGCILKGNGGWAYKHKVNLLTKNLVLTFGGEVPTVDGRSINSGESIHTNYLPIVNCINHVGAGDCFAAHLALTLAYKFSLREAAAIAHSAGRVYVQHPHNRPPTPGEITADMLSES